MKSNLKLLGMIIFTSLLLIGCVTPPQLQEKEFHLTQQITALLPDPGSHKAVEHQQLLTTTVRGHNISFYGIVTIKNQQLALMALTPIGVRIFNTVYNGNTIITEQYIPNIPLPNMTEVIGNIMLAYYSPESWQLSLPDEWTIEDTLFNRTISDQHKNLIFNISYEWVNNEKRPTKIHNKALDYTIELNNLE